MAEAVPVEEEVPQPVGLRAVFHIEQMTVQRLVRMDWRAVMVHEVRPGEDRTDLGIRIETGHLTFELLRLEGVIGV